MTVSVVTTDSTPYGNVGNLLTGAHQYEFNGLLFGNGTSYTVTRVEGLLGHDSVSEVQPNTLGHGGSPGLSSYNSRTISFSITITGDVGPDIETKIADLERKFVLPPRKYNTYIGDYQVHGGRKVHPAAQLVFTRPLFAELPRVVHCRCLRVGITSDYRTTRGYVELEVDFEAADPLKYSLNIHRTRFTLDYGDLIANTQIEQWGDHPDGYSPLFKVQSPSAPYGYRWPHFQREYYDSFENRSITQQVAFDLFYDEEFTLDMKSHTTTPQTVINAASSDNWWTILPGTNVVQFERFASADNGPITVDMFWRDVWK